MKFHILEFIEKLLGHISVSSDRICLTTTLHEELYGSLLESRLILIDERNVSNRNSREK
jgi:hypothetical protein